jgi:hypothetical protein
MSAPEIMSQDIDANKFSFENLVALREEFPESSDEELARYLLARNNNLDKAKAMLHSAVRWRLTHLPVFKADCGREFTSGKLICNGVDKEGRPLLIWTSKLNVASDRDLEQVGKTLIWWTEYASRQLPPHLSKYTIILDRTGATRENADFDLMKYITQVLQVNIEMII